MQRIIFKTHWASLVLACLFLACSAGNSRTGQPAHPAGAAKGAPGVAITPKNFPDHTLRDVKDAFRLAKALGDHTVLIYQWQHLDLKVAELMVTLSRKAGVNPILGLSPTTLDQGRKELDVVGLTTYPSYFHKTPADLVPDYYSWVYRHARRSDEILLMEVGWPTGGSGSEGEQVAYIRRLPALLEPVNVSVVAWALLHDIALPEFDADLNTVGLITNKGRKKPGYEEFKALKNH